MAKEIEIDLDISNVLELLDGDKVNITVESEGESVSICLQGPDKYDNREMEMIADRVDFLTKAEGVTPSHFIVDDSSTGK